MITVVPTVLYIIFQVASSHDKMEMAMAAQPAGKVMPILHNSEDSTPPAPVAHEEAPLEISVSPPTKAEVSPKVKKRGLANPLKSATPALSPSSPEPANVLPALSELSATPAPILPDKLPAHATDIEDSDTTTSRAARMQLLVELLEEKQLLTERKVALLQRMETLELFIPPDTLTHLNR